MNPKQRFATPTDPRASGRAEDHEGGAAAPQARRPTPCSSCFLRTGCEFACARLLKHRLRAA